MSFSLRTFSKFEQCACSILGQNPNQITIANSQLSSIELFYNSSSRTKLNLSFLPNMHRFVSRQHSSRFIQSSWICFPFLACHACFLKWFNLCSFISGYLLYSYAKYRISLNSFPSFICFLPWIVSQFWGKVFKFP